MPLFDLQASKEASGRQNAEGAVKIREDLDRYEALIAKTHPEVVIECGTWEGGSALWFAKQGLDVVTIDIHQLRQLDDERITFLLGNSTDQAVYAKAAALVDGRRTMVVLDSNHEAGHVGREIKLYGPLVTVGCHLVVEDAILRWIPGPFPGPLEAIETHLVDTPGWERDLEIEDMFPVTMSPMGWWRRTSDKKE